MNEARIRRLMGREDRRALRALGLSVGAVDALEKVLSQHRFARVAQADARRNALSHQCRRTKAIAEAATALDAAFRKADETDPLLLREMARDFGVMGEFGATFDALRADDVDEDRWAAATFPEGERFNLFRTWLATVQRVAQQRVAADSEPKRRARKDEQRITVAVNIGLVLQADGHELTSTVAGDASDRDGLFYQVAAIVFACDGKTSPQGQLAPNGPLLAEAKRRILSGKLRRGVVREVDGRTVFYGPSGNSVSYRGSGRYSEAMIERAEAHLTASLLAPMKKRRAQ